MRERPRRGGGRETSQYLRDEINSGLRINTKVNERPLDLLPLVLLLLEIEHVIVEKLLQSLIRKVNAKLLKRVQLENLKARNVQDADEFVLVMDFERVIDAVDYPEEETVVNALDKGVEVAACFEGRHSFRNAFSTNLKGEEEERKAKKEKKEAGEEGEGKRGEERRNK